MNADSVDDVAAALLAAAGQMTAMKLQKLAYYVQSWHLVRHGRPAFADPIEAWADGPVVRRLFDRHRGRRNRRHGRGVTPDGCPPRSPIPSRG